MPYKCEKIRIAGSKNDKRIKLTEADKEEIKELVGLSAREIARRFGVSRRLISFVLHPEQLEKNKQRLAERGGTMIYYNREKNREYMKKHRHHKQKLYLEGEI